MLLKWYQLIPPFISLSPPGHPTSCSSTPRAAPPPPRCNPRFTGSRPSRRRRRRAQAWPGSVGAADYRHELQADQAAAAPARIHHRQLCPAGAVGVFAAHMLPPPSIDQCLTRATAGGRGSRRGRCCLCSCCACGRQRFEARRADRCAGGFGTRLHAEARRVKLIVVPLPDIRGYVCARGFAR